jgi:hypothetical protein
MTQVGSGTGTDIGHEPPLVAAAMDNPGAAGA